MGSPLIEILACFLLEFLDLGLFEFIIPKDFRYFRHINNILFIYLRNNDKN